MASEAGAYKLLFLYKDTAGLFETILDASESWSIIYFCLGSYDILEKVDIFRILESLERWALRLAPIFTTV